MKQKKGDVLIIANIMLNPLTFYLKNKKRAVAILSILLLSVFCISFITTLIKSVYYTCADVNISPYECFSIIASKTGNNAEQEAEVKEFSEVDKVIEGFTLTTSISTVFGTTNSYIVFSDDINDIFEACHFTMAEGEIPVSGSNEIVVHEKILKNKDLKIGDELSGFKIVGSYTGKSMLSFGCMDEENKSTYAEGVYSYVVFPKSGELKAMNQQLSELPDRKWEIFTYAQAKSSLEDEFSTINLILLIVVVMVSCCLSIAMAALVYTIYLNRYDEFAILNAIGYKKKTIKRLILQETIMISLVAWILGYLLSIVGLGLANQLIYVDMGQSMRIFTIDGILYTFLIPVLVVLCTTFPAILKLSKTDLISVIERR